MRIAHDEEAGVSDQIFQTHRIETQSRGGGVVTLPVHVERRLVLYLGTVLLK